MDNKAGIQISKKAFLQSALILLAFMLLAGILTRVVPRQLPGNRPAGLPGLALADRPG